jgi:YD repeat-containing protein
MNKSIALALCSALAAVVAQAEPPKPDRDFDGLKGKVHQVSHGNQIPSLQDKSTNGKSETYDEEGNLIATVEVGADSYLRHTYFHFDAKTVFEYWGEKPPVPGSKEDYSRLSGKFVYKYDGKGNRIEKSDFDKKGSLTFMHKYLYDPKGRRISESTEVGKEVRELVKFTYDDAGNIIGRINGTQTTAYRYAQFDSAGNWAKRIIIGLGIKEGQTEPTLQESLEERSITYY